MTVVGQYEHRQSANVPVAIAGLVALVWLVALIAFGGAAVPLMVVLAAMAIIVSAFTSLRTSVDADEVRVAFRFGWPRRTIPIVAIEQSHRVRNRWWHGLGVRLVPGGMLYAVWGLDAVEVAYRTSSRRRVLRIGTDDPEGLDRAIAAARSGVG